MAQNNLTLGMFRANLLKLIEHLMIREPIPDLIINPSIAQKMGELMPVDNSTGLRCNALHVDSLGMRVFSSPFVTIRKQVRFPRSKRKRIRRKWAKQAKNWAEEPAAYLVTQKMIEPILKRQAEFMNNFIDNMKF